MKKYVWKLSIKHDEKNQKRCLRARMGRGSMTEIQVLPYDPTWSDTFQNEAAQIRQALGTNCLKIHHVGSTSVPGLAAKPIIDMIPVVRDILKVDPVQQVMVNLGYEPKGELGIPFRRYFKKNIPPEMFNIHIYEEGNPEIERYLTFRDWMKTHEDDRQAYATLKEELAQQFPDDIYNYCLGKTAFVFDIDHKAGFKGLRIVTALMPQEWDSVKGFRQTYFFDKIAIKDPYTWTFNHPDHIHFVLYQGTQIVGYAHLQLWPDHDAVIRIIVIDQDFRNRGLGRQFMGLCEKWLRQKGYQRLYMDSSPEARHFYEQQGYTEVPVVPLAEFDHNPPDIAMRKIL